MPLIVDSSGGNLVVADDEFFSLAEQYRSFGAAFDTQFNAYIQILKGVCADGVSEGNIYENLVAFMGTVQLLQGEFTQALSAASALCESYVETIDDADDYLY